MQNSVDAIWEFINIDGGYSETTRFSPNKNGTISITELIDVIRTMTVSEIGNHLTVKGGLTHLQSSNEANVY
jgi:butyrate kinase